MIVTRANKYCQISNITYCPRVVPGARTGVQGERLALLPLLACVRGYLMEVGGRL